MSVQLNVSSFQTETTGTLELTVHDPAGQVVSVRFTVTDGSGVAGSHTRSRWTGRTSRRWARW